MEPQASQPQLQQQINNFKAQPLPSHPPRVLEYSPHFGPEGQTFTVSLQAAGDKAFRIGFGTLVVDTKQYSANGYVTLSCTVPNFAITKWFVPKVPLYILQMENDMVLESWPFGDYSYYDEAPLTNNNGNTTPTNTGLAITTNINNKRPTYQMSQSPNSAKKMITDLDLANSLPVQTQVSPLAPSTPTPMGVPRHDDYTMTSASSPYESLYSSQPPSPYGARPPMNVSYNRPGYYNNQIIASSMPAYSQSDLAVSNYSMSSGPNHSSGYVHSSYNPQTAYMPPHPNAASIGSMHMPNAQHPYSGLLNKASLKCTGNMDDMAINWSGEEWESHRRLVQFWRRQDGNEIHCNFAPVSPAERQPNSIVVSCIYWAEKNDCFLTSVDCIYLLESLIAVRFTVEEKNRIRRNLEGFRPITVSKCKPESAEFFKLIMSFPNPKPRNIEKDVKVFPWKVLSYALKKIIGKYTASYSSTASIQTDAFHNANFPHGSTLPITPQQQTILESSIIV
ncbi:hypothetical protein BGZ82_010583 [Podila clonocystis]|nr:hypothetical protein BGZ82_010583 [Podila clonocystis]